VTFADFAVEYGKSSAQFRKKYPLHSQLAEHSWLTPLPNLEHWEVHYSSIYSQPVHINCLALSSLQQLPVLQELDNPFTMEDMKLATRRLKSTKSPGQDGIPSKILENGGKPLLTVLFRIFEMLE